MVLPSLLRAPASSLRGVPQFSLLGTSTEGEQMVEGGVSEWGRQQRLQAGSDFVFLFYTSGERAPWGLRNRSALLGGKQPPPRSSLLREGGIEHLPLSRLLPPFPSLCLILPSCPCGMGWQRGLEVWGWVGAGPSEAHVERSAGKGAAAAVSLFLAHWFLLGTNPGSTVSRAGRASRPVWGVP